MSDIMQLQDVLNCYAGNLKSVEEHMEEYLHSEIRLIPQVSNYLISSGGKRFRPLLLLIASDFCGYKGKNHYPMSAVIEFIHTASLLHDDVVDHASTRRGKVAANNVWGNSASVLVGDFLYSKSFKLMADYGNFSIVKLLSTTTNTMAEGEVLQLMKCGDINITEKDYLAVVEKKTAILISAACAVGGILAEAPEEKIGALTKFGIRLGMAFQITDDTLDYVAVEEEFGKAIGKDINEGKITLPLIYTLKKCSPEEKKIIKKTVKSDDPDTEDIRQIVSLIEKYGGIEYALNKAKTYIDEAKALLKPFEDSRAKESLLTIADYIIERKL